MEIRLPNPALLPLPPVERLPTPTRPTAPASGGPGAQPQVRISNVAQTLASLPEGEQVELPSNMRIGSAEWAGAQLLLMIGLIARAIGTPPQSLEAEAAKAEAEVEAEAAALASERQAAAADARTRAVQTYRQIQGEAENAGNRIELSGELATSDAQRLEFRLQLELDAPDDAAAVPFERPLISQRSGLKLDVAAAADELQSAEFRFEAGDGAGTPITGSGRLLLARSG